MNIIDAGWKHYISKQKDSYDENRVGRVITEHKQGVILITNEGELVGVVPRKFIYKTDEFQRPKAGDWVVFDKLPQEQKAVITQVLPRLTTLARKEVGKKIQTQVIATNIDVVFVVMGLDEDYNVSRVERYLLLVKDSGARAVIILNKSDKATDLEQQLDKIKAIANETPIISIEATNQNEIEKITKYIKPGETLVFVGSSGVGKSTLINNLIGFKRQHTQEVREKDDKGKHTTTRRELILLANGAVLIDTPGMRELGTVASEESLSANFADIESLALKCQFRDCDHEKSDGCAILQAIKNKKISRKHYEQFLKLRKEVNRIEAFDDTRKQQNLKLRAKKQSKTIKKILQNKNRR
ncbi:MAG: ribosome small subunit-dependent GTPase A [Candidatus Doudnabacteria bacterium]|nr:ribosome small subunit-dependent GTPase A [Candidatus Doudnabacteria bacterium]